MYLEEVIIFNYRSCRMVNVTLSDHKPNIYIGLNDSGKSTFLQSLDLLFNPRAKFNSLGEGNYKSDLSNTAEDTSKLNKLLDDKGLPNFVDDDVSAYVIGKFRYDKEEGEEFVEINLSTPLKWSLETNEDGVFWFGRKFNGSSDKNLVLMNDSTRISELWNLGVRAIDAKISELEITSDEIKN